MLKNVSDSKCPYRRFRKHKTVMITRLIPDKEMITPSTSLITKCSLCRSKYGISQYVTGPCSICHWTFLNMSLDLSQYVTGPFSICHWTFLNMSLDLSQYITGPCSGVSKEKLVQNRSEYGQLPITAKQQLAIAILLKLKIAHNGQT